MKEKQPERSPGTERLMDELGIVVVDEQAHNEWRSSDPKTRVKAGFSGLPPGLGWDPHR